MALRSRLLIALLSGALLTSCGEPRPPRHAVLLLVDTLRQDAIGHSATPNLDTLFARGQTARVAWSASTWTVPSVLSLLTGAHVREHAWDHRGPFLQATPISPRPTLATVLSDAGFATTALFANPVLQIELGYERGFQRYRHVRDAGIPAAVRAEAADWDDGRRHFLYVHLMGPHEPLRPSRAARERHGIVETLPDDGLTIAWARKARPRDAARHSRHLYRRAYRAVLEDTDAIVGEILAALEPWLDDAVVVFTSDHGEMLGERGLYGHGGRLDEPLTRVPFVGIRAGALPPLLNGAAVPHLFTRALGIDHDWSVRADPGEPLVAQRRGGLSISPDGVRKGVWPRAGGLEVWDVADYPAERRDAEAPRADLRSARAEFERRVPEGRPQEAPTIVEPEIVDALRRLGYMDDEEDPPLE